MSAFDGLYQSFTQYYYTRFDGEERGLNLKDIYHERATMTFEGDTRVGKEEILKKIESLPFTKIQHIITTVDGQVLPSANAHLLLVNGRLKTDDDPPHCFVQSFILFQENNAFVITNDVFRLSVHDS